MADEIANTFFAWQHKSDCFTRPGSGLVRSGRTLQDTGATYALTSMYGFTAPARFCCVERQKITAPLLPTSSFVTVAKIRQGRSRFYPCTADHLPPCTPGPRPRCPPRGRGATPNPRCPLPERRKNRAKQGRDGVASRCIARQATVLQP